MTVDKITPDELREALRPLRPDAEAFERGVRERIEAAEAEQKDVERVETSSPFLRAAATFLPIPILGGKVLLASGKAAPIGAGTKALGYLALPAVSIFLVLGAFVLSAFSIRQTRTAPASREEAAREALKSWWRRHWWIAVPFYVGISVAIFLDTSAVIFGLLIASFVVLAIFLTALSRAGLATRWAIASVCSGGMIYLGIPMMAGLGRPDGLLDGRMAGGALYCGALALTVVGGEWRRPGRRAALIFSLCLMALILGGFLLPPRTAGMLQRHVESFDAAPHSSATWHKWEVAATWLKDSGRAVDWSVPRAFLRREELAGEQNPFVLGVAMRVGLLEREDYAKLRELAQGRRWLLRESRHASRITSLKQSDWVIRVLAAQGALSEADRDRLAERLDATWKDLHTSEYWQLEDVLTIARLRDVIGRPGDIEAERADVHAWLLRANKTESSLAAPDGGFFLFEPGPTSDMATWAAVCLMERYGIPDGIDILTVRSAARDSGNILSGPDWIAAATRWKIDSLPGRSAPSLGDYLGRDHTLLACILLVLLALYATLRAPRAVEARATGEVE